MYYELFLTELTASNYYQLFANYFYSSSYSAKYSNFKHRNLKLNSNLFKLKTNASKNGLFIIYFYYFCSFFMYNMNILRITRQTQDNIFIQELSCLDFKWI